jgi:AraC-like DNA-binding protein
LAVLIEHLVPGFPHGWRYQRFEAPALPPHWHAHPEYELTCIVRGSGTRLIGDSVEEYQAGDLVLIGPELPHTYVSMADGAFTEVVVIHFSREVFGRELFDLPVFAGVAALLDDAARGLRFESVPPAILGMGMMPPAERTVALLQLLVELSRQPAASLAAGSGPLVVGSGSASRVEAMVAFVHDNYEQDISAQDVAAAVYMNPSAASRLFSRSTSISITRYINIVRINAACRLLRDTELPIAAVAGTCGYANLSHFNRQFRRAKSTTPRRYRNAFRTGEPEPPSDDSGREPSERSGAYVPTWGSR